jgi:hypothetical protein
LVIARDCAANSAKLGAVFEIESQGLTQDFLVLRCYCTAVPGGAALKPGD